MVPKNSNFLKKKNSHLCAYGRMLMGMGMGMSDDLTSGWMVRKRLKPRRRTMSMRRGLFLHMGSL